MTRIRITLCSGLYHDSDMSRILCGERPHVAIALNAGDPRFPPKCLMCIPTGILSAMCCGLIKLIKHMLYPAGERASNIGINAPQGWQHMLPGCPRSRLCKSNRFHSSSQTTQRKLGTWA